MANLDIKIDISTNLKTDEASYWWHFGHLSEEYLKKLNLLITFIVRSPCKESQTTRILSKVCHYEYQTNIEQYIYTEIDIRCAAYQLNR